MKKIIRWFKYQLLQWLLNDVCECSGDTLGDWCVEYFVEDIITRAKKVWGLSKKRNTKPQFSQTISDFCNMVTSVKSDYEWNKDEISRLDRLTQDYLHTLELGDLSYHERAKIATQLTKCRQERRASKDTVETLEPFVEFIESEKGRQTMNLMREALGKTRKVERHMENRIYRYKVLDKEDIG